jgi:hypothetical protein
MARSSKINPAAFEGMSPDQAASVLLTEFNGVAREAEAAAWHLWEDMAGGEPWRRPGKDEPAALFFDAVVKSILNHTEDPKVARVNPFGKRVFHA